VRDSFCPRITHNISRGIRYEDVRATDSHNCLDAFKSNGDVLTITLVLIDPRALKAKFPVHLQLPNEAEALEEYPDPLLEVRQHRILRNAQGRNRSTGFKREVKARTRLSIRALEQIRRFEYPLKLSTLGQKSSSSG
jgi:hypothetical protein